MSKFLKRSLLIFIIKDFWTIVFIFIVISTTFRPICPPAFFRCLSNSGTFMELWTTSFIETTGVTCSVMANGIRTGNPALVSIKDVVQSSVKVPEFDKYLKKARGHIGQNIVEITIKMKPIVQKSLMMDKINYINLKGCLINKQKRLCVSICSIFKWNYFNYSIIKSYQWYVSLSFCWEFIKICGFKLLL